MAQNCGGIPASYNYMNALTAAASPNTFHTDDRLTAFFYRYLLQKAISVFKWQLPESWKKEYFLYCLYVNGFIAVFNTNKYGVICQHCGLSGQGLFYEPTHAVITSPLLKGITTPRIGTQCVLFQLQPDYGGITDLVHQYASLMSLACSTAGVNILNSKLSYVFTAGGKTAAESFKKLYDKILSGEPAVVQDSALLKSDGSVAWEAFSQNVGQNFIAPQLLDVLNTLENQFDTKIGIPNANTDKRERLVTDEVNANNTDTYSNVSVWLELLQDACRKTNDLFYSGERKLWVDWRFKPVYTGGNDNGDN